MLQQATLHAEKERTFGDSIQESPQMNQQEALLMSMLRDTQSEQTKGEEKLDQSNEKSSQMVQEQDACDTESDLEAGAISRLRKIIYTPQFLLSLESSPLVPRASYWVSELPPIEFFRLSQSKGGDHLRQRRKSSNGSSSREDRKSQRARQKENKKKGQKHEQVIEEEHPDWMDSKDVKTGNSILDFEIWRLKMRIETAKRNGEPINPEDELELQQLQKSSKIVVGADTKGAHQLIDRDNDGGSNKEDGSEKEKLNHKHHIISADDQFELLSDLPSKNNVNSIDDVFIRENNSSNSINRNNSTPKSTVNTLQSGFSSFFDSPVSKEQTVPHADDKRSSRLMSILADTPSSDSPSRQQPNLSSPLPSVAANSSFAPKKESDKLFFQSLMEKSSPQPPQLPDIASSITSMSQQLPQQAQQLPQQARNMGGMNQLGRGNDINNMHLGMNPFMNPQFAQLPPQIQQQLIQQHKLQQLQFMQMQMQMRMQNQQQQQQQQHPQQLQSTPSLQHLTQPSQSPGMSNSPLYNSPRFKSAQLNHSPHGLNAPSNYSPHAQHTPLRNSPQMSSTTHHQQLQPQPEPLHPYQQQLTSPSQLAQLPSQQQQSVNNGNTPVQSHLPYGAHHSMPGMTPNHPLMKLLSKNKRKSISDSKEASPSPPPQSNQAMQNQLPPGMYGMPNVDMLNVSTVQNTPNFSSNTGRYVQR